MADADPMPSPSWLIDDPMRERTAAYDLQAAGPDTFTIAPLPSGLLRLYGGAMVSQALAAAQATVPEGKACHSLHAYFLRPGLTDVPLTLAVTRETDGRSFAMRDVRVSQDGKPALKLMASFQGHEEAPRRQLPMPQVAAPETLPRLADLVAAQGDALPAKHRPFWCRPSQIDWRPVEPFRFGADPALPDRRHFWFRFHGTVDGPLAVQQRLLAYASDSHIFQTSMIPLGLDWTDERIQTASLDHAIWFHEPDFRVDDWLLYALHTPAASNWRGLTEGQVFRRDGRLVATVMQQGLGRLVE